MDIPSCIHTDPLFPHESGFSQRFAPHPFVDNAMCPCFSPHIQPREGAVFMLNFIYNPVAGKGKAQRFRRAIEAKLRSLGVPFRFWETIGPEDAKKIARTLEDSGEKDIIAMGGDGTVNEVLNGLPDPSRINFGLIPCGSGNDFAAAVGIPATPEGALDVVLKNSTKPTDYLECSGVRGLNIIGAGIDVEILGYSNRARVLKGSLKYFVSLLRALARFEFYRFRSEFGGKTGSHNALIVCACNGQRFGGGIRICPEAAVDDGKLDVVIVEDVTKGMIPGALVKLMKGKILEQRYTKHDLADRLKVVFEKPSTIQIDGELYENLPFDVRVVCGGLNMYRA